MSLEAVLAEVRDRVVPEDDEVAALEAAIETLTERAEAAVEELPVEADVRLVGSTARGTWVAGVRDVDLFVRFPTELSREELERYGLQVGRAVLPDGHEEYAEHPYVSGSYDGVAVDCVPCYAVESATTIRSAVDRTPFHDAYLADRIEPVADDVRVAKAFLTGIGVYGSDLRTRGFSGYLVELLVLEYDGVEGLLAAAADWELPVRLDPADHGDATFEDPLVVVDPTDPDRNVAAVCSTRNVARVVHYAREFLAEPRIDLFEPVEPEPYTSEDVRAAVEARSTTPVAVRFPAPDVVDDQLYPQLEKSLVGVTGALERAGFDPLRRATFADDRAVLFVECGVATRPAVTSHRGPPVDVRDHAEGFYDRYATDDAVTGPFIDDDGRYVVERPSDVRTPADCLEARLFEVALGADVADALREDHEILLGGEVAVLAERFGSALARYFRPRP